MALPTTNLTLHGDASDTGKLFTTLNGGGSGVHTGTPADGNAVQVWDDEGDGISDVALIYPSTTSQSPTFRSGASALMKSGLTELDFDGSDDELQSWTQSGGGSKAMSAMISASAGTMAIVFYAESITDTDADVYNNQALIGDAGNFCGLFVRDVSGVKKIRSYNWDGSADTGELTIATSRVYIAIWIHGGGNLDLIVIDDTGTETSTSVASGNTTDLANRFSVGRAGGASNCFNGRIGEFVTYTAALSGSDLTDLKTYFKDKWLSLGGGGSGSTYPGADGCGVFHHDPRLDRSPLVTPASEFARRREARLRRIYREVASGKRAA